MILGADPDQLNTVAQRISSRADDYDNAGEDINYWLRRMDWHGPQADAFRSLYDSRMRPQLQAVATALREAASVLRANAAQQQAASGEKRGNIPGYALPPDGGNRVENLLDDARRIKDIIDSFWRPPFPGLPFPFPGLPSPGLPIVGLPSIVLFGSTALHVFEISDFLRMHGGKPAGNLVGRSADQLRSFGLNRVLGSGAGKTLGVAGAVWSAATMPSEIQEFVQDLGEWDWNDEASIKEGINSFTDIMIGAGSIAMVIPGGAPVGIGLMGIGLLVKGAVHVVDGDVVGDALWKAGEFGNEAVDFVGDVGESAVEFGGDVRESAIEFAGDVGESAVEFGGDVRESAIEFTGDVEDAIFSGAKKFLGW